MKKIITLGLSLALSSFSFANSIDVEPFIIGGDKASPNKNSHHARLMELHRNYYIEFCGGSIVTDSFILTAAHCITDEYGRPDYDLNTLRVVVKNTTNNIYVEEFKKVASVTYHENYVDAIDSGYDIALLELESPITDNVNSITIPVESNYGISKLPLKTEVKTIGMGYVSDDGDLPSDLQETTMKIEECHQNIRNHKDSIVCAVVEDGNDKLSEYSLSYYDSFNGINYNVFINYDYNKYTKEYEPYLTFSYYRGKLINLNRGDYPPSFTSYDKSYYTSELLALDPAGGTCRGDSGGSMFVYQNNKVYQYGITSYGNKICEGDTEDVFTSVSYYYDWIKNRVYGYPLTYDYTKWNNGGHSEGDIGFDIDYDVGTGIGTGIGTGDDWDDPEAGSFGFISILVLGFIGLVRKRK